MNDISKSALTRFWGLIELYKVPIRHIHVYALFIGIVNLTLPLGIQAIINFLQAGEMTSTWIVLVCFVLLGIAITGILQILQLRIVENIQQDLFTRSAFEIAFRLPKISFSKLDKVHAPELVNRFFDTLTIQKGLPKILIDFSLAVFQILFGLILLTVYSPYFIVLGLVLFLLIWLVISITGPKGMSTSLKESKNKYNLAYWLEEVARVSRTFKMQTEHNFHLKKSDHLVFKYLSSRENHFQVLLRQFQLFVVFKVLLAFGLLVLGGYLVFREQMNIGQFVAAEIIIILVLNSVEKILRVIESIYDVLTALEKIGSITDLGLDNNGGTIKLNPERGIGIRARDMRFRFPDSEKWLLDNISFNLDKGDRALLTGPSGSGKSLILQILAGIYRVNEGEIYVNDIPISNYSRNSLLHNIGICLPTNQIFDGTIRDNILIGRDIKDSWLLEVIRALKLEGPLALLPDGLETKLESGGKRLPRSLIQKLHIARLVVGRPQLVLMEDPLQFIANDEKDAIIDYLTDSQWPWTLLVISDYHYWQTRCAHQIDLTKR